METDIKTFIDEVSCNTGVSLSVFDTDGVSVMGDGKTEKFPENIDGVFSDIGLKRTIFRLKYKNRDYIGKIDGAGKAERNYAYLISALSEKAFSKNSSLTEEEFYKAVLLGEASYYQIEKYTKKYQIPDGEVCVMLINLNSDRTDEVVNVLKNYSAESKDFVLQLFPDICVLIKFSDTASGEYRSLNEYAEFLAQSVYEETGAVVKISIGGTVDGFNKLNISFNQASACERMSRAINHESSVHSYKEYILYKILEDLPRNKSGEYLEQLLSGEAKEIFSDEEMIATAEEFLENSLNVSETSRKLFLHRNTLIYRLDKIENATGLNIRKFSDAVTFRLITYLMKFSR